MMQACETTFGRLGLLGSCVRNRGKTRGSSRLVMAGQQPVEDGRERPYVPAIPIIWHCAILIEIAGTSPAMTP